MDKSLLVKRLKATFRQAKQAEGLKIDWMNLTLAYEDVIPDLYMLAVSAPSLSDISCYKKIQKIVALMAEYMPDERKYIAIVRVYDSKEELKKNLVSDIERDSCQVCERVLHIDEELVEV